MKKRILFICTGNAGRSQMSEAILRNLYGEKFEVFSAGVEPWKNLHPMALMLMREEGIDMTRHYPKHIKKFCNEKFDIIVTIGDRAKAESGQFAHGIIKVHWPINDPAEADGTPDSEPVFRSTRQAIVDRIRNLVADD